MSEENNISYNKVKNNFNSKQTLKESKQRYQNMRLFFTLFIFFFA